MPRTVLAFHGFTLNGEQMRSALGPLVAALEPELKVVCLNAPHVCSAASVVRIDASLGGGVLSPPHLSWWNASDDGRDYRGWEETSDLVREALDRYAPASVLGFSQGAILTAAVAALAQVGEFPALRSAVMIAGRVPRASRFQAAFQSPIALPSLHVWGERDALVGPFCPELADHFDPTDREIAVWAGGHMIPTRGAAYDALLGFLREHG